MIVSGGAGGDTSGGNKDNETASMKTKLLSGDHSDEVGENSQTTTNPTTNTNTNSSSSSSSTTVPNTV